MDHPFRREALTWLLSADAYLYLQQIGCGPVLHRALRRINYESLARQIREAAQRSKVGRDWLSHAPDYGHLAAFVSEIKTFLAARETISA